jgi:hypothetical protein
MGWPITKATMATRRFIFMCGVLLLAAVGGGSRAGWAEVALDKPSTFGNASLQLPRGWVVIEAGSDRLKAKAPQADKDLEAGGGMGGSRDSNEFSANVSIKVSPVAGEVDIEAQQKNLEKAGLVNYRRIEEPTAVTVGGAKGITFGGTFVVGGKVPVRTRLYLVTISGKLYVIAFSTLASKWGEYQEAIEASVGTFAVKA